MASPGEATLVENTVEATIIDALPPRIIGDKAYDSDGLDEKMAEKYQVEMIAPNRRNRSKTQDGRQLRRYKRRWKVERFFAWLHSYRHITVRYDYYAENYFSMIQLACIMIFLNLILR